jgi:N-ethylmaleimide reductase
MKTIFDPITIGNLQLPNRIFMAPMTRGRADPGGVPNRLMAEYYGMRADAGLIITEATAISPHAVGWLGAPGIWSEAQVEAWKLITDAVHAKKGHIFLQLWHMGRVSHPDFLDGELPVAPSEIAAHGETNTPAGKKLYVTPRALSIQEIHSTIQDYAIAAKNAIQSGFDGVEIHGANGYLIDQFIRDGSNKRTDEYGVSIENRLRFLFEVTSAVVAAVGANKVGVRLSPKGAYNDMQDNDPIKTFCSAAEMLNGLKIAYLHTMEALPGHMMAAEGERVTPHIRKVFTGTLVTNGGYNLKSANNAIANNEADAIAFGVPFLANPDLVARFRKNITLNAPDFATFYTPGPKGYTDYSIMQE